MKIKRHYIIKGQCYKVKIVKDLRDEDVKCDGLVDLEAKIISIEHSLAIPERLAALLHELTHAACFEAHLHHAPGFDALEEIVCEAVSQAFLQLL